MDSTAIDLIQKTAIDAEGSRLPEQYADVAVALPKDYGLLSMEPYHPLRFRFRGRFDTTSLADFAAYTRRHGSPGAEVFIDGKAMAATAIFNLGTTAEPGHADWTGKLQMERTPAFAALLDNEGDPLSQRQIIDLIEDWAPLFTAFGEPADEDSIGPEIKLSRAISALRKLKIAERSETETRQENFKQSQSRLDSVEASSDAGLPATFSFTTEPYLGLSARTLTLRLAVLTGGREPALKYRIVGRDQVLEDIAQEFKSVLITDVGDAAHMTIGTFRP